MFVIFIGAGRIKLNNADGSVTIEAKVNSRRELEDDGSCARYLLEGDVRCCFDEIYGDVSGNCGISSFGKANFKEFFFLIETFLKFYSCSELQQKMTFDFHLCTVT